MKHIFSLCLSLAIVLLQPASAWSESKPEAAMRQLQEKGINVDGDNFIKEIAAKHEDNVQLFLAAGASAAVVNKNGTSALMAALNSSPEIWQAIFSSLGGNAAEVINQADSNGDTVFLKTIDSGNETLAQSLLEKGADFTKGNNAHVTPLILAAQKKRMNVAKLILALDKETTPRSVAVNQEDERGNSALIYAINSQNDELVDMLIAGHANALKADIRGVTPLMLAASAGNERIVDSLIAAGANVYDTDKSGNSPITIAIKAENIALARKLIEKADNKRKINFITALNMALSADKPDQDFAQFLFSHIDVREELPKELVFKALDKKCIELAKSIIARGVDAKAVNEDGETLIYHAFQSGSEEIVLSLMQKGADIAQLGVSGVNPITIAVNNNMATIVEKLLEKGASADQKSTDGYSLAEVCIYRGFPETLKVLLAHKVNLDKQFALLWSIRDGKGKAVPVLLENGAIPNIMNQDGMPAVVLAAELGQIEAIQAFINHKASIDYPSKNERLTALSAASKSGNLAIVKLLVEAGAKINAVDIVGMTPLAHAVDSSRADVVEYLLSKGADVKTIDAQHRSLKDIAAQVGASPERDKVLSLLENGKK